MRSQQGAGAAESPQSPPVNPGISRLGATLAWILLGFCFRRDVLVPKRQQGRRGGEGNTGLLPGQSQLWLGLTPVMLWGPLAVHPSSTPITSSPALPASTGRGTAAQGFSAPSWSLLAAALCISPGLVARVRVMPAPFRKAAPPGMVSPLAPGFAHAPQNLPRFLHLSWPCTRG